MDECTTTCVVLVVIMLIYCINKFAYSRVKIRKLDYKHVVVTGGSSGIGKAAAEEASRRGAHVTIIGRNVEKLENALIQLKDCSKYKDQKFNALPLDVTNDFKKIQSSLNQVENDVGPIFMLINSAGQAVCGTLDEIGAQDMKYLMDLNYFGSAFTTKAVLKGMKDRDEGIVVFVSSQAALLGIYGLSCYGAAKWAVRGLGEALIMETVGTGITVTLSYPPDTDTPGFEIEEKSKSAETKLICASGGLYSPETVAHQLIQDALVGNAYSVVGAEGWMMKTLTGGALESITSLLVQSVLMGPLRIIMACYLMSFHRIINKSRSVNKSQ